MSDTQHKEERSGLLVSLIGSLVVGCVGVTFSVLTDSQAILLDGLFNLASRLEGANKAYDTGVLISGATYQKVSDQIFARRIDRVAVVGKIMPVDFFELLGVKREVDPTMIARVETYESGFDLYVSRRFSEAAEVFRQVLEVNQEDVAAKILRNRCIDYQNNPPPDNWDGCYFLTEK